MPTEEKRSVTIPAEILRKLEEKVPGSGASSVDELAGRILRDWVTSSAGTPKSKNRVSRADEAVIEERLKALGYV